MGKRNMVILAAVVVLALLLAGVSMLTRTQVQEDQVIICVDGREYARVPLSAPRKVTISQTDGAVNVIEVTENGAVMACSTCENQLCVDMGWVTRDNWELRPNGAFIVCLPNRVSVELAVKE